MSDLLFGIPQRSPYNFRFDYALMRIGAVVEEDGARVFLEPAAAAVLDGKSLGAQVNEQGQVAFSVSEQAAS